MVTCSSTGLPARRARASLRSRRWVFAHLVGRLHPGHPPAAGPGGVLDQGVERGHDVAGPTAPHRVGGQPLGGRQDLVPEELGDHLLADVDGEVAVAEGVAQGAVGLHGPGEPEQLVLDLFELGHGHRLEDGGGVAGHPVARAQPAEDVLVVGLAGRRGRAPAAAWVSAAASQWNDALDLAGRHHADGLVDQALDLGPDLPLQQVVEDGPTGRHRHRPVVDGQGEFVAGVDEAATAASSDAGVSQAAGRRPATPPWRPDSPGGLGSPAASGGAGGGTGGGLGPHGGDGLVDQVLVVGGLDLAPDDPLGRGQDDLADPGRDLLDGGLAGDGHLGVGGG